MAQYRDLDMELYLKVRDRLDEVGGMIMWDINSRIKYINKDPAYGYLVWLVEEPYYTSLENLNADDYHCILNSLEAKQKDKQKDIDHSHLILKKRNILM